MPVGWAPTMNRTEQTHRNKPAVQTFHNPRSIWPVPCGRDRPASREAHEVHGTRGGRDELLDEV